MTPMLPLPSDAEVSDAALALSASRGAKHAFVVLVARYRDRVYRLAARMCRNPSDAEEITQETFLHALRGIRSFRGDSRFGTWLFRIAVNEALLRQRACRRRPLELVDPRQPDRKDGLRVDATAEPADELVHAKAVAQRVHDALDLLDEPQRTALVLRDLEELPADEAAAILGVTPDTVRQRAHRARLRLRELLADLLVEPA